MPLTPVAVRLVELPVPVQRRPITTAASLVPEDFFRTVFVEPIPRRVIPLLMTMGPLPS